MLDIKIQFWHDQFFSPFNVHANFAFQHFHLPISPTYWMMKVSHTQYNDLEELEESPHQHLLKLKQKIGVI